MGWAHLAVHGLALRQRASCSLVLFVMEEASPVNPWHWPRVRDEHRKGQRDANAAAVAGGASAAAEPRPARRRRSA